MEPNWAQKLKRRNPSAPTFLPLARPRMARLGIQNPLTGGNVLGGAGGAALALGANIVIERMIPATWDLGAGSHLAMATLATLPHNNRLAAGFAGAQLYAAYMDISRKLRR